jgi:hypothetical protein
MGSEWDSHSILMDKNPAVSSKVAGFGGWAILALNRGFNGKIIESWWFFHCHV